MKTLKIENIDSIYDFSDKAYDFINESELFEDKPYSDIEELVISSESEVC
jgi:hypothetical protein